jgi:hypothetical protein
MTFTSNHPVSSVNNATSTATNSNIIRRGNMMIEGIHKVEYVGVLRLVKGYVPERSCVNHILSDLANGLPGIGDINLIVEEGVAIAEDRLARLPASVPILSQDEAIAIATYSYDLGFNSNTVDGSDNLYVILNRVLRQRNPSSMLLLKPYLYFLMSGLNKLPPVKITCYRGIPKEEMEIIQKNYKQGLKIHWSAFTSTTSSLKKAADFAKPNGIIFRIKVQSGRSIVHYASFPDEEEILLSPNVSLIVYQELSLENFDSSSYYFVDLVEVENKLFVF